MRKAGGVWHCKHPAHSCVVGCKEREGLICSDSLKSNSEYLVRNPVQAALQSNKRLNAKHFFEYFGLALPGDPMGPGTYSRFVQSPLMIDLWMEECPILMIFSYFS